MIGKTYGIDLIAGNGFPDRGNPGKRVPQEPLVKGHALVKVLKEMVLKIEQMASYNAKAWVKQLSFNNLVASHRHPEPSLQGTNGPPSAALLLFVGPYDTFAKMEDFQNIAAFSFDNARFTPNYFLRGAPEIILSKYNSTN